FNFYVHWWSFLFVLVLACMYVCVRVSDLGVTDSCELSCGCWELNPSPLEELQVLLTTEPSVQPPEAQFLADRRTLDIRGVMWKSEENSHSFLWEGEVGRPG
ncbi:hypothetical protein ACQP3L_29790, partial [Escherichia coli]